MLQMVKCLHQIDIDINFNTLINEFRKLIKPLYIMNRPGGFHKVLHFGVEGEGEVGL
jgi:hypothetical protein